MMLLNPYRFAASGGGSAAWSTTDFYPASGAWVLTSSDSVATESTSTVSGIRSAVGKTSGKWYWEVTAEIAAGAAFDAFVGLLKATDTVTNITGLPYSLRSSGSANGFTSPGGYSSGNTVCFALDIDAGYIWVRIGSGAWAGGGDPATGTSPSGSGLASGQTWHPAAGSDNNTTDHRFTLRGGSGDFLFTPPTGFDPIAGGGGTLTWDAATVSSPLVLSAGDTRLELPTGNGAIAQTARSTPAMASGKWYWEIDVVDVISGSTTTTGCGVCDSAHSSGSANLAGGTNANSVGYWCSGNLYNNAGLINTAAAWDDGATLMFALDIAAGKFWVGKDGVWFNSGDPAAGTNATHTGLSTSATYYAAASPWSSLGETVKLDLVASPAYTVPSGFTVLQD